MSTNTGAGPGWSAGCLLEVAAAAGLVTIIAGWSTGNFWLVAATGMGCVIAFVAERWSRRWSRHRCSCPDGDCGQKTPSWKGGSR